MESFHERPHHPPPPADAWRVLETDAESHIDLSNFAPGVYVLRAGDGPEDEIAPWLDLNRHRIRIAEGESIDARITLPPR